MFIALHVSLIMKEILINKLTYIKIQTIYKSKEKKKTLLIQSEWGFTSFIDKIIKIKTHTTNRNLEVTDCALA